MNIGILDDNIIGIYKINFPNGKFYIGLSKDIKRRLKEHFYGSKDSLCERAIKKYFHNIQEIDFDILEQLTTADYKLLSELEKKWIQYYDTTNRDKGYNITEGGLPNFGDGLPWKKLTTRQVIEIQNKLLDTEKYPYIYLIAQEYNVGRNLIGEINAGTYYHTEGCTYPLRNPKYDRKGEKNPKCLSEEKILKIIQLILTTDKTFAEIADICNVSLSSVGTINKGETFYSCFSEYNFPLRDTKKKHSKTIPPEELQLITQDLKASPQLSITQIAKKYNRSAETLYRINKGTIKKYHQDNENYPLR